MSFLADHDLDRIIKDDVDDNVKSMDANIHPQDKSLMNLFVNNADTSQFFRFSCLQISARKNPFSDTKEA